MTKENQSGGPAESRSEYDRTRKWQSQDEQEWDAQQVRQEAAVAQAAEAKREAIERTRRERRAEIVTFMRIWASFFVLCIAFYPLAWLACQLDQGGDTPAVVVVVPGLYGSPSEPLATAYVDLNERRKEKAALAAALKRVESLELEAAIKQLK